MYEDAAIGFGELSKKFEDLVAWGGWVERANALGMDIGCPMLFPFSMEFLLRLVLKGGDADGEVSENSEAVGDGSGVTMGGILGPLVC